VDPIVGYAMVRCSARFKGMRVVIDHVPNKVIVGGG